MIDVSTACLVILVLRTQFGSEVVGGEDGDRGEAANLANGKRNLNVQNRLKQKKIKRKIVHISNAFELIVGVA